ncbi:tetratricopeptide repeat protein [Halarcobacter anaerophilus]|uniref:tetratricopeptide repeat protein n=1 Tax=Halarcobacter anaerophilus TaxID=877500 RepID=UPI0005C8D7AD|nr:tetratricopeptide repeat protein [Halarcobacter anaerophilus]
MKIKTLIKISLISLLTISFTACSSEKKEEVKNTLPIPQWDKKAEQKVNGYIGNWHEAKKDPKAATKIGYAYSEELQDYKKAIEWYKYSNSIKPLPETSNYACYAYQQLKEYNEAIKWCKNAIELGSSDAFFRLGKVYELNKDYDKALTYYKKSFENTNDLMALSNLGSVYYDMKDYKNSEIYFKKAIEKGNLESYQNIASFYHNGLKDNIKASAYAIAVIDTKYSKSSVLRLLKDDWKIPNDIIQKGYELQLTSDEFPIKYKGDLGL